MRFTYPPFSICPFNLPHYLPFINHWMVMSGRSKK